MGPLDHKNSSDLGVVHVDPVGIIGFLVGKVC